MSARSRQASGPLLAFITDPGPIRKILTHLGEPLESPPAARPPDGAGSCRPMTTAASSNRRRTNCPRSTSGASGRYRTQAAEAPGTANWNAVCADARKPPPQGDAGFDASPLHGREYRPRGSRDAHRPASRCAVSIDRAIAGHSLGLSGLLNTWLLRLPRCAIAELQLAGPRYDK